MSTIEFRESLQCTYFGLRLERLAVMLRGA